jgi:hypothetical protein
MMIEIKKLQVELTSSGSLVLLPIEGKSLEPALKDLRALFVLAMRVGMLLS